MSKPHKPTELSPELAAQIKKDQEMWKATADGVAARLHGGEDHPLTAFQLITRMHDTDEPIGATDVLDSMGSYAASPDGIYPRGDVQFMDGVIRGMRFSGRFSNDDLVALQDTAAAGIETQQSHLHPGVNDGPVAERVAEFTRMQALAGTLLEIETK